MTWTGRRPAVVRIQTRSFSTTRSAPSTGSSARTRRATSRNRRLTRFLTTALPTRLVTVKPIRAGPAGDGPWPRCCSTRPGIATLRPLAAASRKSARRVRRAGLVGIARTAGSVRRRGACGPWRDGSPGPCGLRVSPCGHESRAGAYGPAWTVDTCASRRRSPGRQVRIRDDYSGWSRARPRPHVRPAEQAAYRVRSGHGQSSEHPGSEHAGVTLAGTARTPSRCCCAAGLDVAAQRQLVTAGKEADG